MKYYEQAHFYKSGDPWRICDSCGRKIRVSESKRTWDGLYVCQKDFELRHPQELHHDPPTDRQSFPDPRPRPDEVSIYVTTEVATAGAAGDTTLVLDTISGMSDGDVVHIELDNGNLHRTTINGAPSSATITLTTALPSAVAVNNDVVTFDQDDLVAATSL